MQLHMYKNIKKGFCKSNIMIRFNVQYKKIGVSSDGKSVNFHNRLSENNRKV